MLSSPRSLGFVLAAIVGAMLVPGCRPQDGPSGPSELSSAPSAQVSSSARREPPLQAKASEVSGR
jgi:hypothetical protein